MKRLLLSVLLIVGTIPLLSAPLPMGRGEIASPPITAQARSVRGLLASFDEIIGRFTNTEVRKTLRENSYQTFEEYLGEGIVRDRPLGLYATPAKEMLKGDFSTSSLVLMIPITTPDQFLALFPEGNVKSAEEKGLYTLRFDNQEVPFWFRFHRDYVYLSLTTAEMIELKALPDPADFFDPREASDVAIRIHTAKIDPALKNALRQEIDSLPVGRNDDHGNFRTELLEAMMKNLLKRRFETLRSETDVVHLRFNLNPRESDFSAELELKPRHRSLFKTSLAFYRPRPNRFGSLLTPDSAARFSVSTPPLSKEVQFLLRSSILGDTNPGTGPFESTEAQLGIELQILLRDLLFGTGQDLVAVLRGPDEKSQYSAVLATSVLDSRAFLNLLNRAKEDDNLPKEIRRLLKSDVEKIAGISIHQVRWSKEFPESYTRLFGKTPVRFGFREDAVYLAIGPKGKELLKEAIDAKPAPSPLINGELNPQKLRRLAEVIKKNNEHFGEFILHNQDLNRIQLFKFEIEPGETLKFRLRLSSLIFFGGLLS